MPDVFAPPKNPRSLSTPANRATCNNSLPEDCHYQPEDLVILFLLPNVMCIWKRGKKSTDQLKQHSDDWGPVPSCDDGNDFRNRFDDGNDYSDAEESNTLVSNHRQIKKIEVNYDKTSKQVDVHALKETLWHHIKGSPQVSVQRHLSGICWPAFLVTLEQLQLSRIYLLIRVSYVSYIWPMSTGFAYAVVPA